MQFRILGPLEAVGASGVVSLGGRRQRALLAVLILHRNEPVTVDRLTEELWGERLPETAAKTVQVYVSRLRSELGEGRIETRGHAYLLRVEQGELDLDRFVELIERSRGEEPRVAARTLREALSLFRGEPLGDLGYEPWAQSEVARLEELRLAALERRLEADLENGGHRAHVAELEALVREHPLREGLRGQLMLALYRSGRQADALKAYRQGHALLDEQLGLEPRPELRELERRILQHDPSLTAPAAPLVERVRRRRGLLLVLAGAALLLAAAIAAAVVELTSRSAAGALAPPDSVAVIDPKTNGVQTAVTIPGGPTRLAAGGGLLWVASDDSETISEFDLATRVVRKLVPIDGFPSDLAFGEGALWVVDGRTGWLFKVDPVYGVVAKGKVARPNPAYDASRGYLDPVSVAAGLGSVWVTDGFRKLVRVDPATLKFTRIDLGRPLNGVAVGAGAIWATSGASATLIRVHPSSGTVTRIPIVSGPGFDRPYPLAIAVGEGFVWVLNGNTATVTRIDPKQRGVSATVPVGIEHGPVQLAVGNGAAWVADADGTLARIDPSANEPEFIPVGHRLKDVAVVEGNIWVTAGAGLSAGTASANVTGRVRPLPRSSCSPIYYVGGERPQFLIASDLPLEGYLGAENAQLGQAVQFVLRQRRFRAGRYAVGYQVCDDSTIQRGYWSDKRCAANARAYARNTSVIGVIGPPNSGCSQIEVPIANRAPGGPLALIAPSNSYVGLTHSGAGTASNEPDRYYPTGIRNYARLSAADDVQGAADAMLAKQLGVRSAYVLHDESSKYTIGLAADFRSAAAKLGIMIAGSEVVDPQKPPFTPLVRRVREARVDAVFIALYGADPDTGRLIKELRAGLGAGVRIMGTDSLADFATLVRVAGAAAEGMTVSIPGTPNKLPKAGKAFAAAFGRAVGQTPSQLAVYWAQATVVLLDAIARSDGTRASVAAQLFKTKVSNGLLGSFTIDRNGDTTAGAITIFRIFHGRRTVFRVITPSASLLGQ